MQADQGREAHDALHSTSNSMKETQVLQLAAKVGDRSRLAVPDELALVVVRLNTLFLTCTDVSDVERLAQVVFKQQPQLIDIIQEVLTEGDELIHVFMELLHHLSYHADVINEIVHVGIIDTLVSIFPALRDVAKLRVLQLLDHVTGEDDNTMTSPHHHERRIQCLCRVACARMLFNVLGDCVTQYTRSRICQYLTPTVSLLDKLTDCIVTATVPRSAAADQAASTWRLHAPKIVRLAVQCAPQLLQHLAFAASVNASGAWASPMTSGGAARTQLRVKNWCAEHGQVQFTGETHNNP